MQNCTNTTMQYILGCKISHYTNGKNALLINVHTYLVVINCLLFKLQQETDYDFVKNVVHS